MSNNIDVAKSAWSHLSKNTYEITDDPAAAGVLGRSLKKLYDALADDVVLKFGWPEDTPVFGGEFRGKEAVVDLWTNQEPRLIEDYSLECSPEFFASGDRVVMLLMYEYYKIVKNDVWARNCPEAVVMDFRDGQISRLLMVGDSSYWNDAYGWSSRR